MWCGVHTVCGVIVLYCSSGDVCVTVCSGGGGDVCVVILVSMWWCTYVYSTYVQWCGLFYQVVQWQCDHPKCSVRAAHFLNVYIIEIE